MTILIVDDNEPNLYQLQVLLGGNGYQIVTAVNGAEALIKARQNPPDLIISDILMPVMDGFALCREWKKDEHLRQIPFVFYTATYTDERDREFALSLGAERFLVKPEEPEVFVRTIREVIQQVQRPPAPSAPPAANTPARLPVQVPQEEEAGYLMQYNEVLIRKLEAKMQQLEQANRELQRDITERKRAEEALQEAQDLLNEVGRIAGIGGWKMNLITRKATWTQSLYDIVEIAPGEPIPGPDEHVNYYLPEYRPRVVEAMRALIEDDKPLEFEAQLRTAKGNVKWCRAVGKVVREGGKAIEVYGTLEDITERKKAEEARSYLASIVESSNDAIIGKSLDGIIVSWNAGAERVYGHSAAEIVGHSISVLVPPDRLDEVPQIIEKVKRGERVDHFETVRMKKDGELVDVSLTISPIRDAAGRIIGASTIARDITARKRTEEALRESEAELAAAQRIAHVGSWHWNVQTNIARWSDETIRIFGLTPGQREYQRKSFLEMVHPADRMRVDQAMADALNGTREYDIEYRVQGADGTEKVIHAQAEVLKDEAGKPLCVQGVNFDITERRRAEEALRESEELYRSVVNSVAEGIVLQDGAGRIVASNRSAERILGRTAEELKGQIAPEPSLQAIHEDGSPLPGENLPHMITLRTGKSQSNVRIGFPRPDGTLVWVLANSEPIFHARESAPYAVVTSFVDITEHKRAEDALIEERHLLHTLMDNLPDMIYFKDRESHFTRINKALAKGFGLSEPAQAMGKTDFDFFTPEHAQEFYNDEDKIIRTGQPMVGKEEKVAWPDGRVTWDSTTKMPLRDAKGNIVGTFGVSRDITDRKLAEADNARLAAIVNSSDDAIFSSPLDGLIATWNAGAERMYSYKAEEIKGKHFSILIPEDHRGELPANVERLSRGEALVHYEDEHVRKDGSKLQVLLTLSPIKDAAGAVTGISAIARDITLRKRAEAEHLRLVTAIEQSAEGVMITSTTGDIEYVNPAFTRITGYSREEVMGKNPRVLKSGEQDPALYQQLWASILNGQAWHGELINRRKDGSLYTEEMNIAPVRNPGGEITHFIATKQDVTEHKQLEQQFLQAQKMEAVGRLAGGVAHDFNNLLTIINGYAALLSGQTSTEDPRRARLEEILMAGERAASLTRQLLAFSRRQVLDPRVLNLNSVLADIEKMLRRLIGEDVELVTTLKPDLGRVKVDAGQIEQVIMNLAVNARDAMPEGGKLLIETSNVEIDENYARSHANMIPGKYVMMAVSDTGCGMDLGTQAHLFEPFFTTKEEGRGTGLGLATVYGIVKQSGGFIWVYSEPGHGSTFKIYFPFIEEALPTAEPDEVPAELAKGSETVLVVEDEGGVRSLVCEVLASYGYKVLEASGAAQALQIAEQHTEPIHLLLTDVVMPQTGGKELVRRLCALHAETKVLYMSGYTDDAIVRRGILEGGMPFLQKPFAATALLVKIREVLEMKSGTQQ